MPKVGSKPGKDNYVCIKCDNVIKLETDDDILPACPKCGGLKIWHFTAPSMNCRKSTGERKHDGGNKP